jgi:hypothetical protein
VGGDVSLVELDASKVSYSNWWSPWFEVEGDLVVGATQPVIQLQHDTSFTAFTLRETAGDVDNINDKESAV